jgi:hypothetical protein
VGGWDFDLFSPALKVSLRFLFLLWRISWIYHIIQHLITSISHKMLDSLSDGFNISLDIFLFSCRQINFLLHINFIFGFYLLLSRCERLFSGTFICFQAFIALHIIRLLHFSSFFFFMKTIFLPSTRTEKAGFGGMFLC